MAHCYASITGTGVLIHKDIVVPNDDDAQYNTTAYDGVGGRGWCIFEQGVCTTVAAHLHAAESQAAAERQLPPRFAHAQASRPKVVDIGGGVSCERSVTDRPEAVLDEAVRTIAAAKFTGKADAALVPHMLAVFEWDIRTAVARATSDYVSSGQTVDKAVLRQVSVRRRAPAEGTPDERPTSGLVACEQAL